MALFEIFDPKAQPRPIGIDLGTTNSVVARLRDGVPVPIADCDGQTLVPSVVHYGEAGVVVGRAAARLASSFPRDTIVSVKRFVGRGARDPETRRLGPYVFAEPTNAEEERSVRFLVRGGRAVSPVEVSAEILKVLRQMAVDELRTVGGAVITVPAYFDDAQRQATRDAGRLAGLDVLRLLNEPTAAALAYGLDREEQGTFAVYDLGGGTFDVTILALEDGVFQVRSTGGDTALGGDDMDRALATDLLERLGRAGDPSAELVRVVLDAARRAKHALTDREEVDLELDGVTREPLRITRARFDELARPIVARTGATCRRALKDAGLRADELSGVILVGGSTRVPLVRAHVRELFGREGLGDVDPDNVVALGAAIQADLLAGTKARADDVLLLDVLPLSLGIETLGGVAEKILPRNTTIPAGARQIFTTGVDDQTGFDLHVVQGERELAADCRSLARFKLKGIPKMPAGLARLEVTFRVDADGLLSVEAKELRTGVEQKVEVKPSYGLTDEQVEEMLLAALDHGEEDLELRRLVEARVEAERVLLATDKALAADGDLLVEGERGRVEDAMARLRDAIAAEAGPPGRRASVVRARTDALVDATHAWAGRRMDRAIARAIEGKGVDEVASTVEHARGVDDHVAEHERARGERPAGATVAAITEIT